MIYVPAINLFQTKILLLLSQQICLSLKFITLSSSYSSTAFPQLHLNPLESGTHHPRERSQQLGKSLWLRIFATQDKQRQVRLGWSLCSQGKGQRASDSKGWEPSNTQKRKPSIFTPSKKNKAKPRTPNILCSHIHTEYGTEELSIQMPHLCQLWQGTPVIRALRKQGQEDFLSLWSQRDSSLPQPQKNK